MAQVKLSNLRKEFDSNEVLKAINLEVNDKEFLVLVGPSGCGKSTALRLIAGLETITSGEIYIGGKVVNHLPPRARDLAMVFQDYALYPHMNVRENMLFGLKLRHVPKHEWDKRVSKAAEMLGIQKLFTRRPRQLSGGQRQRVAIGRAIVRKPGVFLFDEPLSNLDAKMREEMRMEIGRLHQELQNTIIYVTHDQVEAMTLADRIAVINEGSIQQIGTPLEVYHNPVNIFVAGFIGSPSMNFLKGRLAFDSDIFYFRMDGLRFKVPPDRLDYSKARDGMEVTLGIRPHRVQLAGQPTTHRISVPIPATVELLEQMGSFINMVVSTAGGRLIVRCPPDTEIARHSKTEIVMRVGRTHIFGPDGLSLRPPIADQYKK